MTKPMQHPGDKKRRPFKESKGPLVLADKVRVTCRLCGLVTVKLEYNVALHTRDHTKHHHPNEQPSFEFMTLVREQSPDAPDYVRRAERDGGDR